MIYNDIYFFFKFLFINYKKELDKVNIYKFEFYCILDKMISYIFCFLLITMKKAVSSLLLWASLALWNPDPLNKDVLKSVDDVSVTSPISKISSDKKKEVLNILSISSLETELSKYNFSEEELYSIKAILSDKDFQNKFYEILKKEKSYSIDNIIFSFALWFLYFYAYFSTIKRVRKEYMTIDLKSFSIFWLTSWWMAFLNWFVPGSLVYIESFLLSFTAIWWYLYNQRNWNEYKQEENYKKHVEKLRETFDLFPSPVVKYRNNWFPEVWNKKMAEETWYSHDEVIKYFEENWEVMTLLYKWEDLKIVEKYLKMIEETSEWYEWVAFTMTTKSWELKTFLWTTYPFENWTIRFALHLTDDLEIKKEKEKLEELLRKDHLTGAFNRLAFEEDFAKLSLNLNREWDSKKYTFITLDLDNFKKINDNYWHEIWDEVLIKFAHFIQSHIRWTDRLYRTWWDEFNIIMETKNQDEVVLKLNRLRKQFFEQKIETWKWEIQVWSSWWIETIDMTAFYQEELKKITNRIDKSMYWVKYYKLIKDKLIKDWKISDDWDEKNWIAESVYNELYEFIWVKIMNNYSSFFISKEDLEEIEEIKKWIKNLRA